MTDKEIVLAKYPEATLYEAWWMGNSFFIRETKYTGNLSQTGSRTEAKAWEKAANIIKKQQKQDKK